MSARKHDRYNLKTQRKQPSLFYQLVDLLQYDRRSTWVDQHERPSFQQKSIRNVEFNVATSRSRQNYTADLILSYSPPFFFLQPEKLLRVQHQNFSDFFFQN